MLLKRLFASLILLATLSSSSVMAQTEGTITYQESIKLNIELPPEMASMADQFPSVQQNDMDLFFADTKSLFMATPEKEESESGEHSFHSADGDTRINVRMERPENKHFFDREKGTSINKQKTFGRTFLITGDHVPNKWRIEAGAQSEFLGYTCQKAIMVHDSLKVEAWFTPQIPVSVGPATFGDLPGAILVLTVDDGERSFVATNVDLAPLEKGLLDPPSKGKKVSKEEFQKIMEEKMKEMEMDMKGGTGTKVIFRRM